MKHLKKILIISGISVVTIFILLLLTPILFKGKILELAKNELNNMLTAEVEFSDLKLSFIRNFPNAYIALEDLSINGTGDFEGDTLVAFKSFSMTVDLLSVIRMKNIQIKSLLLDQAEIYARILEDGRVNWDIMKPSEKPEDPAIIAPEEEPSELPFNIALNRFEIRNASIVYRDEMNNMEAAVDGINFFLRGDMSQDFADLDMKLDIAEINFWMDGIRLLNNAHAGLVSEIAADMKNMEFTLKDNQFNLNEIVLKFAGMIGMPANDINIDLSFASERTDFKSLLSLIPAVYMQDFEDVTTTGSLELNGGINGTFNDTQMPSAHINLTVENAMFKYPELPKSVDNINIAAKAFYDGEVFDRTTLDIDTLDFVLAGNPFNAELHVKTPESDMEVAARLAGIIELSSISDIVPMEDITLRGLLECNLALRGYMSTLENERYEDFYAEGMLRLSGFDFTSPDLPQPVKIASTQLNFTPRRVDLVSFDAAIGQTDLSMRGALENFIPFIFNRGTVRGNLNLQSNNIDLNELMTGEKQETQHTPEGTTALSVIEVPKNIDFAINANIGRILFDKLSITNTNGSLLVKDGIVEMQNLAMNLLDGSMVLNGHYNTQNINIPSIDFGMDIRQFDISSTLSSFSILENIFPNPQNYSGNVSANLTLYSVLGEDLSPVLNTIASRGRLQTQNLTIQNSELFGAMADLLKNESWRNPAPGNLNIGYEIRDGRLIVEPIHMNISQARLELSGEQGLDMSLNYRVNTAVPVSTVGNAATDLLNRIPGGSGVRDFRVVGLVGGTAKNPNIRLDVADMAGTVVDAAREQLTESFDAAREQAREEISRQVAAIMAEAERQAENVIATAKQAADRVRAEANSAADRVEREAESKSAIEQRLASTAAGRLRSEGEANALRLEQEAERQAAAILQAARNRADELSRS